MECSRFGASLALCSRYGGNTCTFQNGECTPFDAGKVTVHPAYRDAPTCEAVSGRTWDHVFRRCVTDPELAASGMEKWCASDPTVATPALDECTHDCETKCKEKEPHCRTTERGDPRGKCVPRMPKDAVQHTTVYVGEPRGESSASALVFLLIVGILLFSFVSIK